MKNEPRAIQVSIVVAIFLVTSLLANSLNVAASEPDTAADSVVREISKDAQDWPRFLGNKFDGTSTSTVNFDWTALPKFRWALEVGDGYGLGAVSDGYYFHFDGVPGKNGSIEERLRKIDLSSGKEAWVVSQEIVYRDLFGYEEGPRTTPAVDQDHVYTMGVSGMAVCRRVEDGSVAWSVDTSDQYAVVQNFFGVGSSPLVFDDKLIVMVGGSPEEDQEVAPMRLDRVSAAGSAIVALDRATGEEIWRSGNDLASYSSPRTILIEGHPFILAFARDSLLLLDPRNGKIGWRFEHRASLLESVNAMMPVVDGDRVFISECYQVGSALLKISATSAEAIWKDSPRDRNQSMRCHWATPALVDGYLYGCSGRNAPDSDFRCIEFGTGKVQWTDPRRIRSSVTRVADHLVLLEERGKMQILKPNPEKLVVVATWPLDEVDADRPAVEAWCWAAPIVVGNQMLVRGTNRVVCLELATK